MSFSGSKLQDMDFPDSMPKTQGLRAYALACMRFRTGGADGVPGSVADSRAEDPKVGGRGIAVVRRRSGTGAGFKFRGTDLRCVGPMTRRSEACTRAWRLAGCGGEPPRGGDPRGAVGQRHDSHRQLKCVSSSEVDGRGMAGDRGTGYGGGHAEPKGVARRSES